MWIKELEENLEESLTDNLNFLYKSDKIFIMDNHLAAGWCWLNIVNSENRYNLLHIDRHYDLLDNLRTMQNKVKNEGIEIHNISLQEYLDIQQNMGAGQVTPAFRWDNYILNINFLYPDLFRDKYFSTHEKGNSNPEFITEEFSTFDLFESLDSLFNYNDNGSEWIINVDLDFFFTERINSKIRFLSDQYISELLNFLNDNLERIAVITFCLSPECCGGWENCLEITKKINEVFQTDFELD